MALAIFGTGTMICGRVAPVDFEPPPPHLFLRPEWPGYDAVEFVTIFGLPVWPLRAVHCDARQEEPESTAWLVLGEVVGFFGIPLELLVYRSQATMTLRPDRWLTALVYFRYYVVALWIALAGLAFFCTVGAMVAFIDGSALEGVCWVAGGQASVGAMMAMHWGQRRVERRRRDIRLLLGPHAWGSSDPGTWDAALWEHKEDLLRYIIVHEVALRDSQDVGFLKRGMWTARVAAVLGHTWAEQLTDAILDSAEARSALSVLRGAPWQHHAVLGA